MSASLTSVAQAADVIPSKNGEFANRSNHGPGVWASLAVISHF